jgi:hypothetical protein
MLGSTTPKQDAACPVEECAAATFPELECDHRPVAYDEQVADRIRELTAGESGLSERRMFGGLAFLIDGNMAVSASEEGGLLLRVDPRDTAELLTRPHGRPCVMRGREMAGWLRVDVDRAVAPEELEDWVQIGVAYARSLPPK